MTLSWRDVLELYFGWPAGQIWPNLLASAVTFIPGLVLSHLGLRHHQAKKIDQQTAELKEHLTSTLQGPPR